MTHKLGLTLLSAIIMSNSAMAQVRFLEPSDDEARRNPGVVMGVPTDNWDKWFAYVPTEVRTSDHYFNCYNGMPSSGRPTYRTAFLEWVERSLSGKIYRPGRGIERRYVYRSLDYKETDECQMLR